MLVFLHVQRQLTISSEHIKIKLILNDQSWTLLIQTHNTNRGWNRTLRPPVCRSRPHPHLPLLIRDPQLKREQQVFPQESSRVWLSQPFPAKSREEGGPAVMESYPTERNDTAHALILTHSTEPGRSQDKLAPASQTTEAHWRAKTRIDIRVL